jgi:hypothetical protein
MFLLLPFTRWIVTNMETMDTQQDSLGLIDVQPDKFETRLSEIESRGKAPYFVLSSEAFEQLCEAGDDGNTYVWPAAIGNVLSKYRTSISENVPDGLNVILPLENHGAAARRIRIDTRLKDCVLCHEPDMNSRHRRIFLRYEYERALHGTPANLKVISESSDGYRSTYMYKTVHGEFVFERVVQGENQQ